MTALPPGTAPGTPAEGVADAEGAGVPEEAEATVEADGSDGAADTPEGAGGAEDAEGGDGDSAGAEGSAEDGGGRGDADEAAPSAEGAGSPAPAAEGDEGGAGDDGAAAAGDGSAALSEAQAELAAQRELRARIEARKAEKEGPVAAGTKLSGQAADLLAAVRAVESGEKPGASFFASAPAPRRPAPVPDAPAPVRTQAPQPARVAAGPEALAAVRAVLSGGGAPDSLAPQVTDALGEQAADVLRTDPWQLLAVPGVRPEQADGFARALLGAECGPDDPRRAAALVAWTLERASVQGHTALPIAAVKAALAERSVPDVDEAVRHAITEGVVLVFEDGVAALDTEPTGAEEDAPEEEEEAAPVEVLLGLDRFALAEESLADGLARLANAPVKDDGSDWAQAAAAAPSPSAAELIRAVAGNGLVTHSGGEAARAESAAVVSAAHALGLRAAAAAHTRDGRRRLAAAVGAERAFTVAALLSGAEGPGRDEDGALALDVLVVQDAPQLDVEGAAMLVESLPDGCRLVLGGDPEVLGSAGAGRVFADVLAARAVPHVASRTPDPGPLGELVSGIGAGELGQVEAPGKEVVIVPVRDAGEAVHRCVQLVADSVPRAIGVPTEQTQVITVGHGGSAGTRALNAALKQRLNPGPGRFAGFDPGDRVAYAEAPGRTSVGVVGSAGPDGLHLDCGGEPLVVPKERVESALRHGWALTAHQAAGMRWPAVVAVLPGDAAQGLSRSWVYTAFGRAERHLSVVHGLDQALPRAVAEVPAPARTTRLTPLLTALLRTPEAE
ncbi:helix-hairpin-helix domain-containing protein [Streptomyces sp. TLI_146]|uniref:helix-hairpin-helix domain-containing protein n=1 Tax=Streptomyces sp. TLI_146 TaxID=1938858 RepID=UPI000C701D16|nr:helix-hairpin-helix domain-containing protein [Streptomyces sp. TLI_146]PKV84818.1 ATP-dependent exoDNAse (exonuclease V) alpha subunit [Streptomyces sp. TLI_146]